MGAYDVSDIEDELTQRAGELMVVLDSGEEYELHIHDTTFDHGSGFIETEGLIDGEYRVTRFPASVVEHTYIHKES